MDPKERCAGDVILTEPDAIIKISTVNSGVKRFSTVLDAAQFTDQSSDESIACVNGLGVITMHRAGTVTVTARFKQNQTLAVRERFTYLPTDSKDRSVRITQNPPAVRQMGRFL